jgi:membrane-associated phospholipid phosphatase
VKLGAAAPAQANQGPRPLLVLPNALAATATRGYYWAMARLARTLAALLAVAGLALGAASRAGAVNAFDREIMEFVQHNRSHDLDERSFAAVEECLKAIALSELVVMPLKFATDRERPDGATSRVNSSFPSSHAASAFAAASALGHAYPRLGIPAYFAAAAIGYSRMYERRHYATDVIAGACVGIAAARFSRAHLACVHVDRAQLIARLPIRIDFRTEGCGGLVRIYLSARL